MILLKIWVINVNHAFIVRLQSAYYQEKLKKKKIDEIKPFALNGEKLFENVKTTLEKNWKDFKEILNQKNLARKDCLLLPLRAVLKALKI